MDLASLRAEIDSIDDALLTLFLRRMDIVQGVARYKLECGLPVLQSDREQAVLDRLAAASPASMADYTREFFAAAMAVSRQMQADILEKSKSI